MALTEALIRRVTYSGNGVGAKHADGQGLCLLVKAVGKYWRLNYRFRGKQKTLALGVYPAVSLAEARRRRAEARAKLAQGVDPAAAKQKGKHAPELVLEQALVIEANAWRQAETIRAYVAHVGAVGKPATPEVHAWLAWATSVADRLDPAPSRLSPDRVSRAVPE
jgi:hypothetical protein